LVHKAEIQKASLTESLGKNSDGNFAIIGHILFPGWLWKHILRDIWRITSEKMRYDSCQVRKNHITF